MSSIFPQGHVSASVIAGPLQDCSQVTDETGHMFDMGDGALYIHINQAIAAQWIDALTPIAKEAK